MLKELVKRVKEYNTLLRYMGLKDHQVSPAFLSSRTLLTIHAD